MIDLGVIQEESWRREWSLTQEHVNGSTERKKKGEEGERDKRQKTAAGEAYICLAAMTDQRTIETTRCQVTLDLWTSRENSTQWEAQTSSDHQDKK